MWTFPAMNTSTSLQTTLAADAHNNNNINNIRNVEPWQLQQPKMYTPQLEFIRRERLANDYNCSRRFIISKMATRKCRPSDGVQCLENRFAVQGASPFIVKI
jgi:hypothetical protein